jgi:hypothetical protein
MLRLINETLEVYVQTIIHQDRLVLPNSRHMTVKSRLRRLFRRAQSKYNPIDVCISA